MNTILGIVPTIEPNSDFLGANVATDIVNGIAFYALIFCLIGLILSAGLWAVGAFSNNYTQSVNGKKGFLITAAAALVIGAADLLIDWAYGAGGDLEGDRPGSAS